MVMSKFSKVHGIMAGFGDGCGGELCVGFGERMGVLVVLGDLRDQVVN